MTASCLSCAVAKLRPGVTTMCSPCVQSFVSTLCSIVCMKQLLPSLWLGMPHNAQSSIYGRPGSVTAALQRRVRVNISRCTAAPGRRPSSVTAAPQRRAQPSSSWCTAAPVKRPSSVTAALGPIATGAPLPPAEVPVASPQRQHQQRRSPIAAHAMLACTCLLQKQG